MTMALLRNDPSSSEGGEAQQCRDRLSELPDDVLLLVLDRLRGDVRQVARTCVLSKRWRTLPLMLPRLVMSAHSFLPAASPAAGSRSRLSTIRCLHQATSKFTDALRFFLATPAGGRRHIKRLTLGFPLTRQHHALREIGRLVSAPVARGEVDALTVALDTGDATARVHARRFTRLFRAAPPAVVGSSLRRLSLRGLRFRRAPDVEAVLRECEALETFHLHSCSFAAPSSALRVDAPRSRLRELAVTECLVERVDLVHLPGLQNLTCDKWLSQACPVPVRFGPASAPSLKKIALVNRAAPGQLSFKLSDLLENAADTLEYLYLDFATSRIWVQPENRSDLAAAFSKLKRLHVKNMLPAAGISWTMFLIKAAPLLEHVDIHVLPDPVCGRGASAAGDDDDDTGLERDMPSSSSQHFERRHLETVEIRGGVDSDRDSSFVRLVMERAVNLKLLVLDAAITCADCVAAKRRDPSLVLAEFPEDKDGIDAFVRQIKDGITTSARIIVRSAYNQEFQY